MAQEKNCRGNLPSFHIFHHLIGRRGKRTGGEKIAADCTCSPEPCLEFGFSSWLAPASDIRWDTIRFATNGALSPSSVLLQSSQIRLHLSKTLSDDSRQQLSMSEMLDSKTTRKRQFCWLMWWVDQYVRRADVTYVWQSYPSLNRLQVSDGQCFQHFLVASAKHAWSSFSTCQGLTKAEIFTGSAFSWIECVNSQHVAFPWAICLAFLKSSDCIIILKRIFLSNNRSWFVTNP